MAIASRRAVKATARSVVKSTCRATVHGAQIPAGMINLCPFRYFKTSPKIILFAVMLYLRFLRMLGSVEKVLSPRVVGVSCGTARFWFQAL